MFLIEHFRQVLNNVNDICFLGQVIDIVDHKPDQTETNPDDFERRIGKHCLNHELDETIGELGQVLDVRLRQRLNDKLNLLTNLLPLLPVNILLLQRIYKLNRYDSVDHKFFAMQFIKGWSLNVLLLICTECPAIFALVLILKLADCVQRCLQIGSHFFHRPPQLRQIISRNL